VIGRLRHAKRGPLAVAAILATPLFFVSLMAFSLLLDKPTVEAGKLGDPSRGLVATIYLCSFGVSAAVVLVGVLAMLLSSRVAVYIPPVAAIGVTIALLIPLDTWAAEHTARYPNGVDLVPKRDPADLILRGEWEQNAKRTADQIGLWTIAIAVAAIVIAGAFEIRRRRGIVSPPMPPPPPEIATGDADIAPSARSR
jgi:hypothetical protein